MALKKGEYQAVSLYKFCLCILVVFIHNKTDEYFQLTDKQYMFFEFSTFYVAQIAVPSFMILSAYLLFRGYRTDNAFSKIRSRLSKLAPAYIFWNTVAIPYTVLVTGYRSSGNLIEGILRGGYDLLTSKFNFPLWYIFDLMLFLIFSPVVYKVLKNKNTGIMIIGCLYFLYICGVQLPDIMYRRDVHLYYLLGAYLGIHEFKIYKQRTSLLDMLSGIAGLLLTVVLWNSRVKTIALSIYSLGMMRYFLSRFNAKKIPIFIQKISEANTFVYYTHIFFIGGIKKVVGLLFQTLSFKGLLCCFIAFYMSTALCLFIIIEIRKFVRKGCNRINNPRVNQFVELLVP